jgi:hypothetical protein
MVTQRIEDPFQAPHSTIGMNKDESDHSEIILNDSYDAFS